MGEDKKAEPYAHGSEMWRDYASKYGAITARIICRRYLEMQANTTDRSEREFCRQLSKGIMTAPNMTGFVVYLHSEGFAALNGETELYNDSDKANRLCAGDIDSAVYACEYSDGTHDFNYAAAALADHYGIERVKLVLAAEAKWLGFAGQISSEAYEWARSFNLGDHFYGGFHLQTSPDVLEGLISEIRKEEKDMNMDMNNNENEFAQTPQPEQEPERTVTYTLNELLEAMEPQARLDKALMRECIEGLTYYAAYKAKENSFASEVPKTRELIENFVQYWALDDGEGARPLKDFLASFDALAEDSKYGAGIGGDRDKICTDILRGLYRHGQELVAAQGEDAMGEILSMSRTIKDVSGYFDYEPVVVKQMTGKLVGEVRELLDCYALPGQEVSGISNAGYEIERAVLFSSDSGFAFAHNPQAVSPFVTWRMTNDDGKLSYETGNYYSLREDALVNYISRAEDYKEMYKLTVKQLPERPEPPKSLMRFIDSDYRELFQIPDGGEINIIYPPGDDRGTITRECKFHDEYHFSLKNGGLYHIGQFAEIMERIGARYEPAVQLKNMELVPFTAGEDKFYLPNRDEANTSVGIMNGNFGRDGDRYHAGWTQKGGGEYTAAVQSELQSVMYALRQDLLKDRSSMLAYCESHPEARLPESDKYKLYGFKAETDTRQYFVRCFAERDSHFAVYAYADKPAREIERAAVPKEHSARVDNSALKTKTAIKDVTETKSAKDYTSVLKAIEDGKKTPKTPRKEKNPSKQKNKDEEL